MTLIFPQFLRSDNILLVRWSNLIILFINVFSMYYRCLRICAFGIEVHHVVYFLSWTTFLRYMLLCRCNYGVKPNQNKWLPASHGNNHFIVQVIKRNNVVPADPIFTACNFGHVVNKPFPNTYKGRRHAFRVNINQTSCARGFFFVICASVCRENTSLQLSA